jgi:hypothetical protein
MQEQLLATVKNRTERMIDCLEEFRMAVISATVTGMIDVREEVAEP